MGRLRHLEATEARRLRGADRGAPRRRDTAWHHPVRRPTQLLPGERALRKPQRKGRLPQPSRARRCNDLHGPGAARRGSLQGLVLLQVPHGGGARLGAVLHPRPAPGRVAAPPLRHRGGRRGQLAGLAADPAGDAALPRLHRPILHLWGLPQLCGEVLRGHVPLHRAGLPEAGPMDGGLHHGRNGNTRGLLLGSAGYRRHRPCQGLRLFRLHLRDHDPGCLPRLGRDTPHHREALHRALRAA
mmetsp:Transcript_20287/g.63591  ORF Transcript_20287/g.63591 Transcript_20287/m.63591 type:complete len:242 (+) Transcript_20287:259-984(+)